MGEGLADNPDARVMGHIQMANIACGGHTGDDASMIQTIALARENQVMIGAHPSYIDRKHFGRVVQPLNGADLFAMIHTQLAHFQKLCAANGAVMRYVKPHGALYHQMAQDNTVLEVICEVIKTFNADLSLVVPALIYPQQFARASQKMGLHFYYEVFADRSYQGTQMVSRKMKNAVLNQPEDIIRQYYHWVEQQAHQSSQGRDFRIDTIGFHADNPASVVALTRLKSSRE